MYFAVSRALRSSFRRAVSARREVSSARREGGGWCWERVGERRGAGGGVVGARKRSSSSTLNCPQESSMEISSSTKGTSFWSVGG